MEPYYLNNIQNKESVYLFSGAINIGFGLFLVEFLSRKQAKPLFDHPYKYFLIGVFSIFFTLASFSSTGTIIGVIQLNFLENQSYLLALIPVLILCLGLILPIGFLVYFLDKKITKIKEHKTTRIVQSIIGGAMIVTTIVRLFL
ncbi:hypothetical protein HHU12_14245 [Flammeovirga aprica JL-4]|uniref:Uncharacterized protein n=2 Tax=Flammeovirga aprica TaxID=29528 RepID=A0A7X9X9V9_9BACT|nr:hypothetical protein [Flammeovirga aprica JL-4]